MLEPNVQLTYVIRTFAVFPGNTIPYLNASMPSLAGLAAEFRDSADLLAGRIQMAVATLLKSTFNTSAIQVAVTFDKKDDGSCAFTVRCSVDVEGNTYTEAAVATVKNGQVIIPNDLVSLA